MSRDTHEALATPVAVDSPESLRALVDTEVSSDWLLVDQIMVDAFADVTDDHQWIHVDRARAAESTFGTTIAHGLLTLSLAPTLMGRCFRFTRRKSALNYGFDKVRFITPVKTGARVRATFIIRSVIKVVPAEYRVTFDVRVDVDDSTKPTLAATWLVQMRF